MTKEQLVADLLRRHNFAAEPEAANDRAAAPQPRPPSQSRWQHDLLVLFLRNQLRIAPAMPILALLMAATSLMWTPLPVVLVWFAGALGCEAIQWYLCHVYFRRERSPEEQRDWIGMLSASELLIGMCWTMPLFIFWQSAGNLQQIYLMASVMAVIAVRLLVVNSFMPVLVAGTGVLTIGVALRCAWAPAAWAWWRSSRGCGPAIWWCRPRKRAWARAPGSARTAPSVPTSRSGATA